MSDGDILFRGTCPETSPAQTDTKESKWDMPDELLLLLEKVEKDGKAQPNNALVYVSSHPSSRSTHDCTSTNRTAAAFAGSGTPLQGAPAAMGGTDLSLSAPGSQANGNNELAIALQGAQLPFQANSVLPARPNLPDDPVIPHNGFATVEEGEKAFMHLLRKAGVDANWTWDQTMRTIITDPLYKALNTLAEKKAAWQKVRANVRRILCRIYGAFIVYRQPSSEGAGRA